MGGPGSGKTYSLSTLAEAGLDVFVIVTEPVGLDTLVDVFAKKNLMHRLYWHQITPARPGFSDMAKAAQMIATNTYETLAKMAPSGDRRNSQWIKLLTQLSNFHDQRTGTDFGPIDSFNDNCCLVIDSLSGLNIMAMDLVIGDKPNAHKGEWGIAMGALEKLILSLTSQVKCPFILTAHVEKEVNEISGATQVMAAALGRKLAPKLPRFFSEVVLAHRQADQFFWSTTASNVDLKNRSLPLGDKLPPSFVPVIESYRNRVKAASGKAA
jgi:hypothetical protein